MEREFRILGPLEVTLDGSVVSAGGRRERAILAILLLNIGEAVSVERLIDGVWGEARPTSAKHMVHEYVSRLRTALAEVAPIATRPPGYLLESAGESLDVREFEKLTATARAAAGAHRPADALRSYDQALALWRGDALADVALEGQALTAATRLDHERRLVGEERVDCALALGQHLQLIPELEHRVEEAPLRERTRAQLMLALYRAGRQTEALDRYRDGRALLVEHAGVEPGPGLHQLERAILTHDPALELAPPVRHDAPADGAATGRRGRGPPESLGRRRWTRAALVAGVLVAALVATVIVLIGRTGSTNALAKIGANSAGAIDPGRDRLVDEVHVGTGPGRIAAGFRSLWVVNDFDNTVSRVDPATGSVQMIEVDVGPTAIAVGVRWVWVACAGTRTVDRIDPLINKVTQHVPVGNGPSGIAISSGRLWVTNRLDDTVTKIDSTAGTVLDTLDAGPSPSDIAYGLGALWIANESSATVTRLDPATDRTQAFPVGNGPEAVAVGYHAIWVANSLDGTVSRFDPNSHVAISFPVGKGPSSVLVSDRSLWVADSYGGRIVRIDPATRRILSTIGVGNGPQSLASIGGRVWLSARETSAVHRGGIERVFDIPPDSLDEGVGYAPSAWSVFSVTADGLLGFKRVGGLDGGTLVPDLATSLPTVTNDGLTYTFQLQRGIRYSNGEPVRASDFRRALERDFRIDSPGRGYYAGIVGANGCSKKRCDLSRGVITDDDTGTVILNLRQPDPDLGYKLALPFAYPVPPGVSLTKPARLGVPGTGPYMIRSFTHSRAHKTSLVVLVRNPRFREWSAAAQPDGYPDRIELASNRKRGKQLTAVEQGKADLMQAPFPAARLNEINTRYAAQVHIFQASATWGIFLNTQLPPFDKLAARKALNLAIDRSKAVAGFGGIAGAALTCQLVPAGMAGYRRYCPYTRHPNTAGAWTAPDLARAHKLVQASGTFGQKVVMWTGQEQFELVVGHLAVATLNRLGYVATLKIVRSDDPHTYFATVSDSRTRAQAGLAAWGLDYPAPSGALVPFTCGAFQRASKTNANTSEICDPRLDTAVNRALSRQTIRASAASNASWSKADRVITNAAPWVPLVNTRQVVFVSRRVGNVQANPQSGVLLSQMWVR